MSLIKLAATKWKTMISSLSDNSVKRLSNLIPDKKKYIQGLETGLVNRTKALEQQRGINIISSYRNSKSLDAGKIFDDPSIGRVRIPFPNTTVPLDSKNYFTVGPRSAKNNIMSLFSRVNSDDAKIINLHSRNHELTEISRMDKFVKKQPEINIDSKIIAKIKKKGFAGMSENEALQLNPHKIEPKFRSHFDKKVLKTDENFINKTPYPKISNIVKSFRDTEL